MARLTMVKNLIIYMGKWFRIMFCVKTDEFPIKCNGHYSCCMPPKQFASKEPN